jgi:hypothetical protein
MATNTSDTIEASATIAPATFRLGVDAKGRDHIFRRSNRTIYVVDDGERVHQTRLGRRDPAKWMQFVDQELFGWAERDYAYPPDYRIAKLAEAVE